MFVKNTSKCLQYSPIDWPGKDEDLHLISKMGQEYVCSHTQPFPHLPVPTSVFTSFMHGFTQSGLLMNWTLHELLRVWPDPYTVYSSPEEESSKH